MEMQSRGKGEVQLMWRRAISTGVCCRAPVYRLGRGGEGRNEGETVEKRAHVCMGVGVGKRKGPPHHKREWGWLPLTKACAHARLHK